MTVVGCCLDTLVRWWVWGLMLGIGKDRIIELHSIASVPLFDDPMIDRERKVSFLENCANSMWEIRKGFMRG